MKEENGFLYCIYSKDGNVNEFFKKEFIPSFLSLKALLPNSKVAVYTNIKFDNSIGVDHVIHEQNIDKRLICKARGLLRSPFKKTLFLDTDTIINKSPFASIEDVFLPLEEFSFACCHANAAPYHGTVFPDLNTGVLGVAKNDFTDTLIKNWIEGFEEYQKKGHPNADNDQLAFRDVFINNKKEFYILPPYFNWRYFIIADYPRQVVLTHDRWNKETPLEKKNETTKMSAFYFIKNLKIMPDEEIVKFLKGLPVPVKNIT